YGGRWNPPGSPVVYASESRALAALEVFVHLTLEARTMRFQLYEITLPKRARLRHHGPQQRRSLAASQATGRAWLDDAKSLALVVPSIIVPQEYNYVLNVRHPQFDRLAISRPEPFSFDERLWRSGSPGQ
ncbi:MAG TPA: RES family NAD+ phosphorylase, partial [Woeseiaceae bacterium]|nr:RES family NAD+ phosphorylase [Woeseiaceae bacterium]